MSEHEASMNEELRELFDADVRDRHRLIRIEETLTARDRLRRQRVDELIEQGSLSDGSDYYHAALIFQHGTEERHYDRALDLALEAVARGEKRGRWLAAASADRLLVVRGRPQRFGTQYRLVDGERILLPIDPETSDAERDAWDVAPPE